MALPSVISYPKEYRLGKESLYFKCRHGHKISDLPSMEFYKETDECPTCFIMQEKYGSGETDYVYEGDH